MIVKVYKFGEEFGMSNLSINSSFEQRILENFSTFSDSNKLNLEKDQTDLILNRNNSVSIQIEI